MTDAGDLRRRAFLAVLIALSIVLVVVERRLTAFHALPWIQADSASYFDNSLYRPPLYPLVLRLFIRGNSGLVGLGIFQHLMLVGSCAVLACRFAGTFDRRIIAYALFLSIA